MSRPEKLFGVIKTVMLMNERFDAIDKRIQRLDTDLSDLSRSHAELAQQVAEMRGYLRGRADQAAPQPLLPKD
jgi:prefoldin subunit 5